MRPPHVTREPRPLFRGSLLFSEKDSPSHEIAAEGLEAVGNMGCDKQHVAGRKTHKLGPTPESPLAGNDDIEFVSTMRTLLISIFRDIEDHG